MSSYKGLLSLCIFFFALLSAFSQVTLTVTINSGETTASNCTDGFGGGGPELQWQVAIAGQGGVTYPFLNPCFQDPPNVQYTEVFSCPGDYPASLQVCLDAFEDDGSACIVNKSCLETVCQNYSTPSPGGTNSFTISVSGESTASAQFTISATGSFTSEPDVICNAFNLGTLNASSTIGNDNLSNYRNICAGNTGDPNPWGGTNDAGVWYRFTTGASTPASGIVISSNSDPQTIGDPIDLQLALYESSNGTCTGSLTLVNESYSTGDFNELLTVNCLDANTTYFILVDGESDQNGYFGLEVSDDGIQDPADGCTPLPVELQYFKSTNEGLQVVLHWATYSEHNNGYFTISKSKDGNQFHMMEKQAGNGTSNVINSYMTRDISPYPTTYYQLTQTDYDGTNRILKVLRHDLLPYLEPKLVPNPAYHKTTLVVWSDNSEHLEVIVFDISGNKIFTKITSTEIGVNNIELSLMDIEPGSYIVNFILDGHNYAKRLWIR